MTRAAMSTNTPSALMTPEELAPLVQTHVRVDPEEKASCVRAWARAMDAPLPACASCGVREPPPLDTSGGLRRDGSSVDGTNVCPIGRADDADADLSPEVPDGGEDGATGWEHLEVGPELLGDAFPTGSLVGYDVCLLAAAYAGTPLTQPGAVGWRAEVRAQRMPRGQGHTRGPGPTFRYVDLFGSWFPLPGPHVRPLRQLRTARPRRATQGKACTARPCTWFPVAALDVLRMTPQEQGEWADMVARLEVPLIGPTGAAAGSVDLSRLRSLYTPPDGGAPYYLHPELVDETTGAPMCLLCKKCGVSVTGGKRPALGVATVDYGVLARVPDLAPLSVLEEMLLSPSRLYHVVVKVRGPPPPPWRLRCPADHAPRPSTLHRSERRTGCTCPAT